ncbi:MAG TPA: T9SS type A sorting domain-containing protein, partial [Chitinophagales bacterium]|nr:T9SS type A sorting domain-containing protein [Chitinophagales bacterium]
ANVNIITSSSTQICEGKSVQLKAGSTTGKEFQWQLNGIDIPGATNTTFDAAVQGYYTLVVTDNGCSKTSSPLFITVKPTPATPDIIKIGADTLMCTITASNYKWFRNGLTFNVGSQKVKATKSGAYTVYVTENNCSSDTSAPYYFFMTDIRPDETEKLLIYPNPGNGKFEIMPPPDMVNTSVEVSVINSLGQMVWNENFDGTPSAYLSFDLSHLEPGIYVVYLQSAGKKLVSRLVLSR